MSTVRRLICLGCLALTAAALGLAPSAEADTIGSSGVIAASPAPAVFLTSETHRSATDVEAAFDLAYPQTGDSLSSLTFTLAPGMTVDVTAPSSTCSSAQLQAGSCPARAEIGSGVADVTLTNSIAAGLVGNGGVQTLSVALYAMPDPAGASAEAGIGAVFRDTALNTVEAASGDIVELPGVEPVASLSLTNLPTSLSSQNAALTAIQFNALELKLDGQAASASGQPDDGSPFITMPSTCSPTRIELSLSTETGNSGILSDAFTPTGCAAVVPQPSLGFGFALSSGAGAQRITSVKLRLPKGLSFTASTLRGALEIEGAHDRFQLDHGTLVITLSHVSHRVTVGVEAAGVRVSPGAPQRPRIDVVVTRENHKTTDLHFTLGLQR